MNIDQYANLFYKSKIVSKEEITGYHPNNGLMCGGRCGACGACGACGGPRGNILSNKYEGNIKYE